jgi:hypothetical protein
MYNGTSVLAERQTSKAKKPALGVKVGVQLSLSVNIYSPLKRFNDRFERGFKGTDSSQHIRQFHWDLNAMFTSVQGSEKERTASFTTAVN